MHTVSKQGFASRIMMKLPACEQILKASLKFEIDMSREKAPTFKKYWTGNEYRLTSLIKMDQNIAKFM